LYCGGPVKRCMWPRLWVYTKHL